MRIRAGLLAIGCLALASVGCIGPEHRVNTVPWWKGLPSLVLAPNSLEAHVWREHLHGVGVESAACDTGPYGCDTYAVYEQVGVPEPVVEEEPEGVAEGQ